MCSIVTCLFHWECLCFYAVPQGARDKFSDFVGFIVSHRGQCVGFMIPHFSQLLRTSWNWKFDYSTTL